MGPAWLIARTTWKHGSEMTECQNSESGKREGSEPTAKAKTGTFSDDAAR